MDEVVSSVKKVTDIMAQISSASAEQTAGIEQINQAIVEMDSATQQNSALVEQVAAAAESMQGQAKKQSDVVSVFKTSTSDQPDQNTLSNIASRAKSATKAFRAHPLALQVTATMKDA